MGIPTRLVVPYFVRTRTLVTLMCYQIISFFVLASCLIAPVSGHNTHTTDVVSHAPAPVPTSENAHSAPYSTPFSYESDILITDRQPHLMKTTTKPVSFAAKMAMCVAAGVGAVALLVLSLDQQSVQKQQMLAADPEGHRQVQDADVQELQPKESALLQVRGALHLCAFSQRAPLGAQAWLLVLAAQGRRRHRAPCGAHPSCLALDRRDLCGPGFGQDAQDRQGPRWLQWLRQFSFTRQACTASSPLSAYPVSKLDCCCMKQSVVL